MNSESSLFDGCSVIQSVISHKAWCARVTFDDKSYD